MRQPAQALSPQVTTLSGYKNRSSQPVTTGNTGTAILCVSTLVTRTTSRTPTPDPSV